jgi:hypothetical protein
VKPKSSSYTNAIRDPQRNPAGCHADVAHRPGHGTWIGDGANLTLRHSHGESPLASLEADGKPVGEEARPVARLLRRSPDGVDFVVLVEMVGASLGYPRIVNRLMRTIPASRS